MQGLVGNTFLRCYTLWPKANSYENWPCFPTGDNVSAVPALWSPSGPTL